MTALTLQPRMMDSEAQSCAASADGFHWVATAADSESCRMCGSTCVPLPMREVDQSIVDEINARAAARSRGKAQLPIPERWSA